MLIPRCLGHPIVLIVVTWPRSFSDSCFPWTGSEWIFTTYTIMFNMLLAPILADPISAIDFHLPIFCLVFISNQNEWDFRKSWRSDSRYFIDDKIFKNLKKLSGFFWGAVNLLWVLVLGFGHCVGLTSVKCRRKTWQLSRCAGIDGFSTTLLIILKSESVSVSYEKSTQRRNRTKLSCCRAVSYGQFRKNSWIFRAWWFGG